MCSSVARVARIVFLPIFALVAFFSCNSGNERAAYTMIPREGWLYGDTLKFAGIAPDTATILTGGSLTVALRHENTYPYRNIWLEVNYISADDKRHSDTIEVELCDVYGRWFGKGVGSLFQASAEVCDDVALRPGSSVGVRHIMRVDTLRGIERVGIHYLPRQSDSVTKN